MKKAIRILLIFTALSITREPEILRAQQQDTAQEAVADTVAAGTVPAEIARAREILVLLDALTDTILDLDSSFRRASDEERELVRVQGGRVVERINDLQAELLDLIPELEAPELTIDSITRAFGSFISTEIGLYERTIEWNTGHLDRLRHRRSETPVEGLPELEADIQEARDRLNAVVAGQMRVLTGVESLGLVTEDHWTRLERFLVGRVESLVGRLQIAVEARERLETQVGDAVRVGAPESEIAALRARLQAAQQRVRGIANSLDSTADLLDQRGFETVEYRRFVIRATGEVTGDVLNPRVLLGLLRDLAGGIWNWFRNNAPTLLARLFIIVAFIVLFRVGFRLGWLLFDKLGLVKLSRLLADMVERLLGPLATILGLFTGLWVLGVNPTTLLAGVGVAGIIIGLALQDSLSNLASGFFILATRPFDVDDVIEGGGVTGTVKAMGLANTTVVTFDNRRLMVPNRKIWGEVIVNRSVEQVRRVEVTVKIGYGEDLDRAIGILRDLLDEHEKVLKNPEPSIFVGKLADSWMEVEVRPWVKNEDWWPVLTDLPRLVRLRFAREGIEIPIPRRELVTPSEGEPNDERARSRKE